jgi:hypothetical protein
MKHSALLVLLLLVGLAGCGGVTTYEGSFGIVKAPADDEALKEWVEAQPGVSDVSVTREGKTVRVRYSRDEARWQLKYLTPPFQDLGYEPSGVSWKSTRSHRLVPGVPDWVVLLLAVAAVTILIEGVRWLVRRRKRAGPQAAADGGGDGVHGESASPPT